MPDLPLHGILIAVALTFTFGALAAYPPDSAALVMLLSYGFVGFIAWLKARPKAELPELIEMHNRIAKLGNDFETQKAKLEGLILRGQRG